jgi:hypothetical protein
MRERPLNDKNWLHFDWENSCSMMTVAIFGMTICYSKM